MEALLQRLTGSVDERARRVPAGARWALWIVLLILPGSFLLLPVLIWTKLLPQRRNFSRRNFSRHGEQPQPSTDPQQ